MEESPLKRRKISPSSRMLELSQEAPIRPPSRSILTPTPGRSSSSRSRSRRQSVSQPVAHRSGWSVGNSLVTESNLWPASTRSCHPAPAQRSLPGRPPPSPATPATLSPSSPPIRAHPPSTDRLLHHQHPEEEVHLGREGDLPDGQAQLLSSPHPPPDSRIRKLHDYTDRGRKGKKGRQEVRV